MIFYSFISFEKFSLNMFIENKPFRIILLVIGMILSLNPISAQENKTKSKTKKDKYDKPSHWSQVKLVNTRKINSPNLDFSPTFYKNGIVFVSSRKNWGEVDRSIDETYFDLYYSDLDESKLPLGPSNFSKNINSDLHEGPMVFNVTGEVMFFTRNNYIDGKRKASSNGKVGNKIYRATKGEYDWDNIIELPFNSDEYSCQHPALSADGKRLYFSSDMPGGHGGYDLYFVDWTRGGWSSPVNMGPEINSEANEGYPFLHNSGFLFYSSNNNRSIGGLDIFLVDLNSNGEWKSISIGTPFNSPDDDFGILLDPDANYGFFSSNRMDGKGKDDIYRFEFPGGVPFIKEKIQIPAKVKVFDIDDNSKVSEAELRLFELKKDGGFVDREVYEVALDKNSIESLNFELLKKELHTIGLPKALTSAAGEADLPILQTKSYILSVTASGYEPIEIPLDGLQSGSEVQREIVVPLSKSLCIESAAYVKDKDSGRTLSNIQLELYDETERVRKVVYSDDEGRVDLCLKKSYKYSIRSLASGFEPFELSIPLLSNDEQEIRDMKITVELTESEASIVSEPLKEGVTIVLENIYYDFNKSAIRTGDALELDALVKIMMDYPSIEIDLVAHTDSRGMSDYNLKLSSERAFSAKAYLVSKGIDGSRIEAIGKGETELRNECMDGVDCNEEQHQFNRRTEVVIRKMKEDSSVRVIQAQ